MSAAWGQFYGAAATAAVLLGDFALKIGADRGLPMSSVPVPAGAALYAVSAAGWFMAMRLISLSQIGVALSVFTLLALCAMGVLLFSETLSARDHLGIALAVLAILLLSRLV